MWHQTQSFVHQSVNLDCWICKYVSHITVILKLFSVKQYWVILWVPFTKPGSSSTLLIKIMEKLHWTGSCLNLFFARDSGHTRVEVVEFIFHKMHLLWRLQLFYILTGTTWVHKTPVERFTLLPSVLTVVKYLKIAVHSLKERLQEMAKINHNILQQVQAQKYV